MLTKLKDIAERPARGLCGGSYMSCLLSHIIAHDRKSISKAAFYMLKKTKLPERKHSYRKSSSDELSRVQLDPQNTDRPQSLQTMDMHLRKASERCLGIGSGILDCPIVRIPQI